MFLEESNRSFRLFDQPADGFRLLKKMTLYRCPFGFGGRHGNPKVENRLSRELRLCGTGDKGREIHRFDSFSPVGQIAINGPKNVGVIVDPVPAGCDEGYRGRTID